MDYEPTFVIGDMLSGEEEFIRSFAGMAEEREFPAGCSIVRQGEPIQNLYIILSGMIECSFFAENGRKKIITINNGRWFFGASSMDGNRNTMNYQCITRVIAAVMPPETVDCWDGRMLLALARIQKRKERILNRQLRARAFASVNERVLCVLRDMAHARIDVNITQQTISELVGATRVQVCKSLKLFTDEGYITSEDGVMKLTGKCLEAGYERE